MIMKFQYQKHLEELSQYKVGDIIERGEPGMGWYPLINLLIATGFIVACRIGRAVIIKPIPADLKYYQLNKQRLSKEEINETAARFWDQNYCPKYQEHIPSFQMVRIFIDRAGFDSFDLSDVSKFCTTVNKSTLRGYIAKFIKKGILGNVNRGRYIKLRKTPGYITSTTALGRAHEKPNKPITHNENRAKLYEMAAKAGLYK